MGIMNKLEAPKRKIKNILLNPQFQLKLMSYFVGLFILTTISLYSTTFLFFWKLKEKALNVGIPPGHVFFRFLDNNKADLDLLFIGLALFNFILLISSGFIISHRIAGPLYKIKKHLQEMDPETNDFKLRETDFFKDIEPVMNDLRKRMK
jgi:hypothetical protein